MVNVFHEGVLWRGRKLREIIEMCLVKLPQTFSFNPHNYIGKIVVESRSIHNRPLFSLLLHYFQEFGRLSLTKRCYMNRRMHISAVSEYRSDFDVVVWKCYWFSLPHLNSYLPGKKDEYFRKLDSSDVFRNKLQITHILNQNFKGKTNLDARV